MKPPINSFLREFVQELNELLEIGISIYDKKYDVKLRSIIADAPARSFVKQIRGHGAYFGCDRCEVKGHYSKGSMSYDVLNDMRRTHLSFVNQRQAIYHKEVSPLTDVRYINMIEDFPLDYMHCILLGVVKRLPVTWISKVPYKLFVSQKKKKKNQLTQLYWVKSGSSSIKNSIDFLDHLMRLRTSKQLYIGLCYFIRVV